MVCVPNPKYFDSAEIPITHLIRLLKSKAVLLPGCRVSFFNEKNGDEQHWCYQGGLREYLLAEVQEPLLIEPFEAQFWADTNTTFFNE